MIIVADNALLNNRFYSVTGAFCLALRMLCFYRQTGWQTMSYAPQTKTFMIFIAGAIGYFINPHRGVTTLIPIDPSPNLTASRHPAVSSLEAYQTPAH